MVRFKKWKVFFILFDLLLTVGTIYYIFQSYQSYQKNKNQNAYQENKIRVYAYSSFVSDWGPGPILKSEFEKECSCKVEFVSASDSRLLIQRVLLEGQREGADLLIGIDQFDRDNALSKLKLKDLNSIRSQLLNSSDLNSDLKNKMDQPFFIPFDWGKLTVNTRKGDPLANVKSLSELASNSNFNQTIALEDPRSSAPGLQFVIWIHKIFGSEQSKNFLSGFISKIHSINKNWSTAYGFFQSKKARAVYSYTTSPIYHLIEEHDDSYIAIPFNEGHPVQIENLAVPEYCKNCELAQKFVKFLVSPKAQKIIMTKNYMLPILNSVMEGTPFKEAAENFHLTGDEKIQKIQQADLDQWVNEWEEIQRNEDK